ncbi:MAG: hypothetical protein K0S51_2251 [Bacillales bacterium]|nr:hypothetical protein [Bacillales bacterium]
MSFFVAFDYFLGNNVGFDEMFCKYMEKADI